MSTGVGMLVICLIFMFLTWYLFGREERYGKLEKLLYWLKSTVVTASALVLWLLYSEPDWSFFNSTLFSFGFSGFMNLCRSQAGMMLA